MNKELLDHAEYVFENFVDDALAPKMEDLEVAELLDAMSMEEKLVADHQTSVAGLEPWEIAEITQTALNRLPGDQREEDIDLIFDIVYEAIAHALDRAQR